MKKFKATYKDETGKIVSVIIQADKMTAQEEGIWLQKSDNSLVAVFSYANIIGVVELDSMV
ncbi:MAG: hypothetical protein ACYC5G_05755 [Candidatus Doudnabacteria bacterium]